MSAALQFETRWQGRLIGLHRHAPGAVVDVGGTAIEVIAGGVVVAGVFRAVVREPLALSSGPLQIVVSHPAQLAAARAEPVFDLRWWRTVSMIMVFAVGGLVALQLTPKRTAIDDDDIGRGQQTIARVAMVPKPPKPLPTPPKTAPKSATKTAPKQSTPSASAALEHKPEGASMRTAARRDANRSKALEALTMLGLSGTTATAGVFGAANDIDTALNQLNGTGMANAGPGLGTRGLGGGGTGTTIGLGVLGSGIDPGKRPGLDVSRMTGKDRRGVVVNSERVVFAGALDRAEIQRVLDRAMSRLRYCYERALTSDADLDGKLTTSFVIAGAGDVISATRVQSTVTSEVDACVLRVIRSLKFPTPRGGGQVAVTYPFVFSAH